MTFNIFEPTPVIFRSDSGRILDYAINSCGRNKGFTAIERGDVYALLPEIPTDPRGDSFWSW